LPHQQVALEVHKIKSWSMYHSGLLHYYQVSTNILFHFNFSARKCSSLWER